MTVEKLPKEAGRRGMVMLVRMVMLEWAVVGMQHIVLICVVIRVVMLAPKILSLGVPVLVGPRIGRSGRVLVAVLTRRTLKMSVLGGAFAVGVIFSVCHGYRPRCTRMYQLVRFYQ